MNFGKTLFAQLMEFVPWMSFARIVVRHGGDSGVRNLSCTEQFRAMAFAQLTYCESLRDIGLFADQRQRSTQLEHLGRLGDVVDPACAQTVLQRQLRCRSDQYGLRIGCWMRRL